MSKKILVIGGTRFFGRKLVRKLAEAGNRVTILTRGQTADDFGSSVSRLKADRRDPAALTAALGAAEFDLVYDQMCYNPLDAKAATEVFENRVGHYIMSSTIEVYEHLQGILEGGYQEQDLDLSRLQIDWDYPWHGEAAASRYGAGKRQAEAVLAQSDLRASTVRIAHVLSGLDDFTGRLAAYVERALSGSALPVSASPAASTFTTPDEIVDFLIWLGEQTSPGTFNAGSPEVLTALDVHRIACEVLGREFSIEPCASGYPLSPFDYPARHAMNVGKAKARGFRFKEISPRLHALVREHAEALGG